MALCFHTATACIPPIAYGSHLSGTLTPGTVLTFSGSGTIDNSGHPFMLGEDHKWYWDFDYNGTFTTDVETDNFTLTHAYTATGTYTVAVRYRDDDCLMSNNTYIFTVVIHNAVLKRYYYVKDHLGSVRVTVNEQGNIVSYNDYDAWGMQLDGRCGNSGDANDKLKYNGKELDKETGYHHYGWREYDATIGRFLSGDPLSFNHPNYSPYAYVYNNPVNLIDPYGLDTTLTDGHGGRQLQLDPVDVWGTRSTSSSSNNTGGLSGGVVNYQFGGNQSNSNRTSSRDKVLLPQQKIEPIKFRSEIPHLLGRYEIKYNTGLKLADINMEYINKFFDFSFGPRTFQVNLQSGLTTDGKYYLGTGMSTTNGSNGIYSYSNMNVNFVFDKTRLALTGAAAAALILIYTANPAFIPPLIEAIK